MNKELELVKKIATLMDSQFNILGIKFGLDPLIGLIPGLGDALPLLLGIYLISIGQRMGLPKEKMGKLWMNLAVDTVVGLIPVIGDIGDVLVKSFEKNYRILEEQQKGGVIVEGEIVS